MFQPVLPRVDNQLALPDGVLQRDPSSHWNLLLLPLDFFHLSLLFSDDFRVLCVVFHDGRRLPLHLTLPNLCVEPAILINLCCDCRIPSAFLFPSLLIYCYCLLYNE